jgi:hypothetical protein
MITGIILLLMAFSGIAGAVERPAPLDPNQVPFPYDANQISLDLVGWGDVRTGQQWEYTFKVWVPEERELVVSTSLGLIHAPENLTPHPNGGWFGEYRVVYTPQTEGIRYIRLRAVVVPEDTEDGRTVVLRAKDVPVPVIYVHDAPLIYKVSPLISISSLWNAEIAMTERQKMYHEVKKASDPLNLDVLAAVGNFNLLYPPENVRIEQ